MNPNHAVVRLERSARVPAAEPPPPAPPPEHDADQLAREAARALAEEFDRYHQALLAKQNYPNPADRPSDWETQRLQNSPPEDFSFSDFERLARADPALATARWEQVKAAARRDVVTGWAAARALTALGGDAWGRAGFMALRDRLRQAWHPRHAAEALLIDEIAQYELLRRQWVHLLSYLSHSPFTLTDLVRSAQPDRKEKNPSVAGAVKATVEASRMIDRLQRLTQNAIRTLLNLRRARGSVTVQNSGLMNLNVGPQQVNVGGAGPGGP